MRSWSNGGPPDGDGVKRDLLLDGVAILLGLAILANFTVGIHPS